MAHPAFIVEQLVCQFLNQWHIGLQPTLHLSARSNGAITVNYNLTASLPVPQFEESVPVGPSHSRGNGNRRRRRLRRSRNSFRISTRSPASSVDNLDDTTSTNVQTLATSSTSTSTITSNSNGDQCPISPSQPALPQLSNESIDATSTEPSPPPQLEDGVKVLDLGFPGEVMQQIDEYLYIDPSPSPQTLANFACGFNVPITGVYILTRFLIVFLRHSKNNCYFLPQYR